MKIKLFESFRFLNDDDFYNVKDIISDYFIDKLLLKEYNRDINNINEDLPFNSFEIGWYEENLSNQLGIKSENKYSQKIDLN
jgi:hypothetical protein